MSMLIARGMHSLHSIALCDLVGECYHENVSVFDLYREYSFLLLCRFCVCECVRVGLLWISGLAVSTARVSYLCV